MYMDLPDLINFFRGISVDLTRMFLFVLSLRYLFKTRSAASLMITIGLGLGLPFTISAFLNSIQLFLYDNGITDTLVFNVVPLIIKTDKLALPSLAFTILGIFMGIRRMHKLKVME